MQLSDDDRGFSFQIEAPLDMRFSPEQSLTASDIVNSYPEQELADLIWRNGQERHSRAIARRIVKERPLSTTLDLAHAVRRAVGGGGRLRIHPATRTFQAIRIAVNDELENLTVALDQALSLLGHGGRLVVISYHSLEDTIVKGFMRREARDCVCPPETPVCICGHKATLRPVTRGALRPHAGEVTVNPRSRSARLRAAERL
jgi:16S rRNA (cytosine1402-N4)-methyltransferase